MAIADPGAARLGWPHGRKEAASKAMGVKTMPKFSTAMVASILLGTTLSVHAAQYPYPAEPQYQYPRTDGRTDMKCPKGKKPFQGKCRITRPVY
jgi:hypothetical protein